MSDSANSAERNTPEVDESDVATQTVTPKQRGGGQRGKRSRRSEHPPTVNVRFFVISVLLVFVALAGTWLLHRFQKSRMSSSLLARAEAEMSTDWRKGRQLLREYLQLRPDDLEAKIKLARLQMKHADSVRDWSAAFLTNEDILRENPELDDIRRQQVDVQLRLGRFNDVREHLERLLENDPQNGGLHLLMALAYQEQGEYSKAAGEFDRALQDPDFKSVSVIDDEWSRITAYVAWAELLRRKLNLPGPAGDKYDRMIEEHPTSAQAHLFRAGYRYGRGLSRQAADDVRTALELGSDDPEILIDVASLSLRDPETSDEQHQKIRQALSRAAEAESDDPRIYQLIASYEQKEGDGDEALAALQEGIKRTSNSNSLLFELATRLADLGKEAHDQLKPLVERAESLAEAEAEYLRGCLSRQEGQYLSALEHFQKTRELSTADSPQHQLASVQIAKCFTAIGRVDAALNEYQTVLAANPQSPEARLGLAELLVAIRRLEEARQAYRSVRITEAAAAMGLAKVELEIARQAPAGGERWETVETALTKAEDLQADPTDVAILEAQMLLGRDQVDAARELLKETQAASPDRAEPRAALAGVAIVAQDLETARSVLDQAAEQLEPHPDLDIVELEYWRRIDKDSLRTHIEEIQQRQYPNNPDGWILIQEMISRYYQALNENEELLQVLLNVAQSHPDHVQRWFRLIPLSLDLERADVVEQALQQLRRLEGEQGLYLHMGEAMRLIRLAGNGEKQQLAEARNLLEAATKDPAASTVTRGLPHALLGQVSLLQGKRKEAADQFLLAVKQGHQDPSFWLTTAQLLIEQQRTAEALDILQATANTGAANPGLAMATAGLLTRANQQQDALALARSLVETNPQNPTAHVALGIIHSADENLAEAEQQFRKAIELAPEQPSGWVALVELLMKQGQQSEAEQTVAKAAEAIHPDQKQFALATCYERLGKTEEAEKQLRAAIEANPKSSTRVQQLGAFYARTGQPQLAESTLRKLLDRPTEFDEVDTLAVRRLLAGAIATRSFAQYEESLRLLERNIQQSTDPTTDRRLYARLLVLHPHPDFFKKGLQEIEELERLTSLESTDQLLAARAYDRLENHEAANRFWQELLDRDPPLPNVIAAYLRRQLDRGKPENLSRLARELKNLQPQQFETTELLSRLEMQRGNVTKALELLDAYISASPEESENLIRSKQVADLLADMVRSREIDEETRSQLPAAAEERYRELIPTQPEAGLAYAALLGHEGKLSEALDELERVRESLPLVQVAAAGIQVLQVNERDEAAIQRVKHWIDESRQAEPNSLFAVHVEEALERILQHYDEAMNLNRAILSQVPENAVALNNLAWLLSAHKGQHSDALKMINHAIETVGPKPFLLDTRGLILLEMGNVDAAIDDFNDSWVQDKLPATRFHLARALSQSGDRDSARHHLQAAIDGGLTPQSLEFPEIAVFERLSQELDTGYNSP